MRIFLGIGLDAGRDVLAGMLLDLVVGGNNPLQCRMV